MSKLTTNYGFSMPDVDDYVPDTINALAKTIESIDSNMNVISNKLSVQASTGAISIGSASASGSGSIAIGDEASSDAEGAVAIGNNAKSLSENCIAIGGFSEASIDGEIVLGRYRIIPGYITPGGSLTIELSGETPVHLYYSFTNSSGSATRNYEYTLIRNLYNNRIESIYSSHSAPFVTTSTGNEIVFKIEKDYGDAILNGKINFVLKGFDIKNCSFS